MKPFLSVCSMCNEPIIRDGTGCHCKCHEESWNRYRKQKGSHNIGSESR